jgi:hypothetical protein
MAIKRDMHKMNIKEMPDKGLSNRRQNMVESGDKKSARAKKAM